jgi:hypothetical protein
MRGWAVLAPGRRPLYEIRLVNDEERNAPNDPEDSMWFCYY